MITVSLVMELSFIAFASSKEVSCSIKIDDVELNLVVSAHLLNVYFRGEMIWAEKLDTPDSNFGVESCSTIYAIMNSILSGLEWKNTYNHIHL